MLFVNLLQSSYADDSAGKTKSKSNTCTDTSQTEGYSIEFSEGEATVSLVTREFLPLSAINLDSVNEVLAKSNITIGTFY